MGIFDFDIEVHSTVPAEKLYEGLVLDSDRLVPKILPHAIKSVEIIKGDGGVGTIKQLTFGEGIQLLNSAKERIDAIDPANLTYSYSIIEGDMVQGVLESIRNDLKIIPSSGGCTVKQKMTYITNGDAKLTNEQIKDAKEKSEMIIKAVESYLLENPDAY